MAQKNDKSIMRSFGEFVGHIWKGVKADPNASTRRQEVRRTVEEEDRGNMTLRRTTIEEIEFRDRRDERD